MWRRGISLALKLFGLGRWEPFFRVLEHQGRPSPVFFPPELLDQGLSFALTGFTNTFAFQGHAGWALPWWAEQQVRPDSSSFIPAGVNILTVNLTNRNWTSLALAGSAWKAMVDPAGMLTPKAFGPSWLPAVTAGGETWVPSRLEAGRIRQGLRDGWQNRVETYYDVHEGLAWSSEAMAFRHAGQDWVHWRHRLAWSGDEPLELAFALGLRPFNALTLGPVFRSRVKPLLWSVNRQAALVLGQAPDTVHFGKDLEDPLLAAPEGEPRPRGRARSGWLAGTARWDLRLEPGRPWVLETFALVPEEAGRVRWRSVETEGLEASAALEAQAWEGREAPLGLKIADGRLHGLVKTLANRLQAFDNGGHFTPGAFFYNHPWLRDSTFIAMAHDLWGLHDAVAAKEPAWMKCQTRGGDFRSHSGEWDGSGQTLFFWATHALMTGTTGVLERNWPKFAAAARWLEKARRREGGQAAGLLPAGLSAEHFGPNDHYLWDNFWGLAGMERLGLALARWPGAPDRARRFLNWLEPATEAYRSDLQGHLQRLTERFGGLLPSSPYRHPDAACIGTLAAQSPLDLALAGPWAKANADFLMTHWVREDLFYQPIIHTGGNAYLTAQLARALQCQGDRRWLDLLEGILAFATPTWTWPEAIHPGTRGGCMGDGDHGWACADVLALLRLALVREQGGALLLLPNAPPSWWEGGPLALDAAPTPAGQVSFSLVQRSGGVFALDWELQRTGLRLPLPLVLALPEGWRAEAAYPANPLPWGAPGLRLPDRGSLLLDRED